MCEFAEFNALLVLPKKVGRSYLGPITTQARREGEGKKGSSPGGPETQRGPGFRIVKIECKTTAYGRH